MRLTMTAAAFLGLAGLLHSQPPSAVTVKTVAESLKSSPTGAAAEQLATQIRGLFGKDNLSKGLPAKVDGRIVVWAIEAPKGREAPRLVSEVGNCKVPALQRIGQTDVYAAAMEVAPPAALRYYFQVGSQKLGTDPRNAQGRGLEIYDPDPDTLPNPSVPKGTIRQMPKFESKIFAGTSRDWWIYTPAQYKPEQPACVMVFQDGAGYKDHTAVVFDNLIAKKEMPVTVGIFVNPGVFQDGKPNRSFEYDTLSDQYARFILEEILPEAEKSVKLRHDPQSRAIAGISSGGICAFTVAWERPGEFSKVLSWVGSFTNIASGKTLREGGHNYAALIRKSPNKPIRVFLQAGANDLDNEHGNWPLANQELAKSLAFKRYDYKLVYGPGFHSNTHGRAILPESLRWLWRDYKAE